MNTRHEQKINVTLPGYLITKIDNLVKGGEIKDRSKFLQVGALELIHKLEQERTYREAKENSHG